MEGGQEEKNGFHRIVCVFLLGDSASDAWFSATTTQIAQVLLTMPYSFAQMGFGAGISFQLLYGLLGYWACYATASLHAEYNKKHGLEHRKSPHVIQFFEILRDLLGPFWSTVSLFFNSFYLFCAAIIQLIACGSNVYYITNTRLDKRTWTFIFGACFLPITLLPTARHYRLWSFLGITMTSYTAWYFTISAIVNGQVDGVTHGAPYSMVQYFSGATTMIYTFGGHTITVEIMDAMREPRKFKYVYFFVVLYTFTMTIPSGAAMYWAFGNRMMQNSNAFSVLPRTKFRDAAVVLMLIHQYIELGLIALPLYFMWEKFLGKHHSSMYLKVILRLPVALVICFMAVMIPFFGPINSLVGAFFSAMSSYIIPCAAHLFFFIHAPNRKHAVERPPWWLPSWAAFLSFDFGTVLWMFMVGTCFGAWASINNFLELVHSFGIFAKCYQCPPR